ncbi:anaerobic ribonucleoside-triphosphate reductase activating protein [Hydrogenophaga sp.]|uniref:anaerobic ribonucleoside-triphosphate reductase activating protein n=1 Tax=Hydrogenophaga sp. TaxID=1904254 RepID=UPI0025C30261|nr:anaerobic ribonucleoside-triphosphate reductase activating protein [Hydrogenophaga sp.]
MPVEALPDAPPQGAGALRIGGLTRLTGVDFPGRLAAVVFLQGCPWRCGYCHNPALLDAAVPGALAWSAVRAFLQQRRGLLDGVVFSGGEPTLQAALVPALAEVRALGFATGLHTGGMYPERLAQALPQLDWVGLDVKAPAQCYDAVTGTPGSGARAAQSLRLLLDSGVALECRTTWHAGLFGRDGLFRLADALAALSVPRWVLQACSGQGRPQDSLSASDLADLGARFPRFECR